MTTSKEKKTTVNSTLAIGGFRLRLTVLLQPKVQFSELTFVLKSPHSPSPEPFYDLLPTKKRLLLVAALAHKKAFIYSTPNPKGAKRWEQMNAFVFFGKILRKKQYLCIKNQTNGSITIEQIKARYSNQWVLVLDDPNTLGSMVSKLARGIVLFVRKDKRELAYQFQIASRANRLKNKMYLF